MNRIFSKQASIASIFLYLLYFYLIETGTSNKLLSRNSNLVIHIVSKNTQPLKYLSYCVGCPSPETEGSVLMGIVAKYGIQEFAISGEVIYCVPNYAEKEIINNSHHLSNRIVFIDRGEVSFLEKIVKVQEQTTAVGVIIADTGDCDDHFRYCRNKIGTVNDGGFAAFDDAKLWSQVTIPVVLISFNSAEKLRKLMKIEKLDIPGLGTQNVSKSTLSDQELIGINNQNRNIQNHADLQYLDDLRELDAYQNEFHGFTSEDEQDFDFPFDEL